LVTPVSKTPASNVCSLPPGFVTCEFKEEGCDLERASVTETSGGGTRPGPDPRSG
jgi:hypothetical protein